MRGKCEDLIVKSLLDHVLVFLFKVRPDVHAGGVVPDEKRFARLDGAIHGVVGGNEELIVDCLHPLLSERPRILAGLFAPGTEARVGRSWILRSGSFAFEDAARPKLGTKLRSLG